VGLRRAAPRRACGLVAGTLLALVLVFGLAALGGCRGSTGPEGAGAWHTLRAGENLWRLSQRYGVAVDAIRAANGIEDVHGLEIGQRVWIPGRDGSPPAVTAPAPGWQGALERTEPSEDGLREPSEDGGWGAACAATAQAEGLAFEWPVLGRLTSRYGASRRGRGHDGLDLAAQRGAAVRAAEAGKVVYAGDDLGDYGRVVIVRHQGSWATVYAHNDRNLVDEGDFVEKGDEIARVGRTGNASAPHVHFEIRRSNRPRDPLQCLP
jgi:murein DD-endopeptidase MepM/ murein hydrolase activator NlpD